MTVMGMTGKRAARMREAFIEAFNMMEDNLRNPIAQLPIEQKLKLFTDQYRLVKEKREGIEMETRQPRPDAVGPKTKRVAQNDEPPHLKGGLTIVTGVL